MPYAWKLASAGEVCHDLRQNIVTLSHRPPPARGTVMIDHDVTSGERYEADLVVQAQLRGQESFILIHVEHQAQAQADFGRRMFRYFARLHDRYALPVYHTPLCSFPMPGPAVQSHQCIG